MDIIESLSTFWEANSSGIIASLIIGFIFFVLGPLGLWFSGKKVKKEHIKKAKENLLDVFEGMLVNREELNLKKLTTVFHAVEREIGITLEESYDLENIFGDLALRFEKSKHLSPDQKEEYFKRVNGLINEIREEQHKEERERIIPRSYSKIINDLRTAIENNDQKMANSLVDGLEKKLIRVPLFEKSIFYSYKRLYRKNPVRFFIIVISVMIIYIAMLFLLYKVNLI